MNEIKAMIRLDYSPTENKLINASDVYIEVAKQKLFF